MAYNKRLPRNEITACTTENPLLIGCFSNRLSVLRRLVNDFWNRIRRLVDNFSGSHCDWRLVSRCPHWTDLRVCDWRVQTTRSTRRPSVVHCIALIFNQTFTIPANKLFNIRPDKVGRIRAEIFVCTVQLQNANYKIRKCNCTNKIFVYRLSQSIVSESHSYGKFLLWYSASMGIWILRVLQIVCVKCHTPWIHHDYIMDTPWIHHVWMHHECTLNIEYYTMDTSCIHNRHFLGTPWSMDTPRIYIVSVDQFLQHPSP